MYLRARMHTCVRADVRACMRTCVRVRVRRDEIKLEENGNIRANFRLVRARVVNLGEKFNWGYPSA